MDEKKVAQWMFDKLQDGRYFYQEVAVYQIMDEFGKVYTCLNGNGNRAINKKVLTEFKKISGDKVIWERGSRAWRLRGEYDSPSRQQS